MFLTMNTYKMTIHYYSHFYILTFFEVIFYKYYIFPYENQLILNLIGAKVDEVVEKEGGYDKIKNQYPEVHDFIVKLMFNCGEGANNADNAALFQICDVYLFVSSFLFFALFVVDVAVTYFQYACNDRICVDKPSITQTEMSSRRFNTVQSPVETSRILTGSNTIVFHTEPIEEEMGVVPFEIASRRESIEKSSTQQCIVAVQYYGKNSVFLAELIKTMNFIILIGVFEYLFFAFIVCKLKPIDLNYMLCTIMQKIV